MQDEQAGSFGLSRLRRDTCLQDPVNEMSPARPRTRQAGERMRRPAANVRFAVHGGKGEAAAIPLRGFSTSHRAQARPEFHSIGMDQVRILALPASASRSPRAHSAMTRATFCGDWT